MRVKGLIFILVIVALGFGLAYVTSSSFVEETIEYQGSVINGAKVELEGFEFELIGLKVAWDRLQVADAENTMQNLFETGETEFDMQFWPLLWRKVVIDDLRMTEFRMNTEREEDGYFEVPEEEMPDENAEPGFLTEATREIRGEISTNARMEFTDVKDDINTDSLMALVDLRSINKIDSLQNALQGTYTMWDSTLNSNSIQRDALQIRDTLQSININEIKTPQQAISTLELVRNNAQKADSLRKEINALKTNFQEDIRDSRNSLGQVDEWVQRDIQRASDVARLPELDAANIGTALFGESLLADINRYLDHIKTARTYANKLTGNEEDEDKPERYEGRNYEFSDKYNWPALWIKDVELSGYTNTGIAIGGSVTNISSDQTKTGEPIRIAMKGSQNDIDLTLDGELNYLGDEPQELFSLTYEGFGLQGTRISPSELLPYDLNSGTGRIGAEFNVIGKRIDTRLDYLADGIAFDMAGSPKSQVDRLIRNAISSTDQISATVLVDNLDGPLRTRVRSNIDDLFLNALRQTVAREVENAKRQIQNEVESRVNAKREEVESLVAEKEKELRAEYDRLEKELNDRLKIIEDKKKEIEAKQEELKKKGIDAIRNKIGF